MRPVTITGIESNKMRRRPTWSITMRARKVQTKFVMAMEREVSVGEEKSKSEKMVAEKYMNEFCMKEVSKQSHYV